MEQVGVGGKWCLAALILRDWDLMRLGEIDEITAGRKLPFTPGCDNSNVWFKRIITKFKTNLIIAFTRGAMTNGVSAHFTRNLNLFFRNQRSGDRGAKQIEPLILRVGAKHWEDIIAHKFFTQIFDKNIFRLHAEQQSLVACRRELLSLTEIGREGDDLSAVISLQPFEDD